MQAIACLCCKSLTAPIEKSNDQKICCTKFFSDLNPKGNNGKEYENVNPAPYFEFTFKIVHVQTFFVMNYKWFVKNNGSFYL